MSTNQLLTSALAVSLAARRQLAMRTETAHTMLTRYMPVNDGEAAGILALIESAAVRSRLHEATAQWFAQRGGELDVIGALLKPAFESRRSAYYRSSEASSLLTNVLGCNNYEVTALLLFLEASVANDLLRGVAQDWAASEGFDLPTVLAAAKEGKA